MLNVKRKRLLLFISLVFIVLLVASLTFTFMVPSEQPKEEKEVAYKIFGNNFVAPIEFTSLKVADEKSSLKLDTGALALEFSKQDGSTVIYDVDGSMLVGSERLRLEVYDKGIWKSVGAFDSVEQLKISDEKYRVTKFFVDETVFWKAIYDVAVGSSVKLTVEVDSKVTAEYRLIWIFDDVASANVKHEDNKVCYSKASGAEFFVDWSDVKREFGDITINSISSKAQGKKQELTFNIGKIEVGKTLVLDPTFGNTKMEAGTYLVSSGNVLIGGNFTSPSDANGTSIISITWAGDSSGVTEQNVKAVLVSNDLTIIAVSEPVPVNKTRTWRTNVFATPVPILADTNYFLTVIAEHPLYLLQDNNPSSDDIRLHDYSNSYTSPTDPTDGTIGIGLFSIYATYLNLEPTYSSLTHNSTLVDSPIQFSCLWRDDVELSHHIFSINSNGTWLNDTATAFTSTPELVTVTKTLDNAVGTPVSYKWYANDTSNNWAATTTKSFTVTSDYSSPTSYNYMIYGPYLEKGGVYNGIVNVTVNYPYQPSLLYVLNGTDGIIDSIDISESNLATNVVWNITSDMVYQRSISFNPDVENVTVYIVVPDTENPFEAVQLYSVSVVDLAGLTGAYVEVLQNIDGYTRVIESQPLDTLNAMVFKLVLYQQYTLRVVSNEGTWTFNLPADAITSKSYSITKDMIAQVDSSLNVTVAASRTNATSITVSVDDWQELADSITTEIRYFNVTSWVTVYSQTDSGYIQTLTWTEADSNTNYLVVTEVQREGETLSWQIALPKPAPENVWTGYFEILGTWPFPANQLIGLFIVGLFFTAFSWRDVDIACLLGCIIAAVMVIIGFLDIQVAALAMGFMVTFLMFIHRGKQQEGNM